MKSYKNNELWEKAAIWIVVIGIIALAIYSFKIFQKGYSLFTGWDNIDVTVTGLFGDFFGGVVGSLWALAGVFLYFSALKVQQEQLEAQKKDMKQNEKLISQQQFETTFFGLLQTQKELRKGLYCKVTRITRNRSNYEITSFDVEPSSFFSSILKELRNLYKVYNRPVYCQWNKSEADILVNDLNKQASYFEEMGFDFDYVGEFNTLLDAFNFSYWTSLYHVKENNIKLAKEKDTEELMCCSIYGHVFLRYQEQLGHYFRHLYNVVKFLDNEKERCLREINNDDNYSQLKLSVEKRFSNYFSFIQSMLSSSELAVLFYNSMLFPKSKKLYVEYGMFDNLLDSKLIKKEHAVLIDGAKLKNKKELFQDILDKLVEQ
jgi:hypothetical protein